MAINYSGTIAAQLQAVRVTEEITPVSINAVKGSGVNYRFRCRLRSRVMSHYREYHRYQIPGFPFPFFKLTCLIPG